MDALSCKVVCLVNTKRFTDAFDTLQLNAELASKCAWEKGYVLYRLNRHDEALQTMQGLPADDIRVQMLTAQVLYRLGRYAESAEAFAAIEDDETDPGELAVNRSAALCAGGTPEVAEQVLKGASSMLGETADLAYNRVCAVIARGDMEGALELLDRAEELFAEEADEHGLTEEELRDGRIVYMVQRGLVCQRLGQHERALEIYEEALKQKPSDGEVAAVASNNLFSLRGKEHNLFDSAKKAKALNLDEQVEDKLTAEQRRVFALNRCLLALYMGKVKECTTALVKLEKEYAGSELPLLVRAALLARDKRMEDCTALLQQHARENPKTATLVLLTLAQIQLSQGAKKEAIAALESMDGAHRQLGVVGSIVKLYEAVKDEAGALRTLARAAGETDAKTARKLNLLLADMYRKNGNVEAAVSALEKTVQGGDKDPAVIAQLVQACAGLDVAKAEKYAEMLPPFEAELEIDVQELEKFQRAVPKREVEEDQEAAQTKAPEEARRKEKRSKKKSKGKKDKVVVTTEDGRTVTVEAHHLPKRYADLVEMGSWGKPDPERWLPWHQRSYNRKLLKKRKGAGTASGGAQGGASSAAAAALDRGEKFQAQLAAQAESPQAESPAVAGPGSNKKKGKKGRR